MKQFNKKSHWHFYCDKILTNSGEFFVNDNTEVSGNFILNKDASASYALLHYAALRKAA